MKHRHALVGRTPELEKARQRLYCEALRLAPPCCTMVDEVAEHEHHPQDGPQLLASSHLGSRADQQADALYDLGHGVPQLHVEGHQLKPLWQTAQEAEGKEPPFDVAKRSRVTTVRHQPLRLVLCGQHLLAILKAVKVEALCVQGLETCAELGRVETKSACHDDGDVLRSPVVEHLDLVRRLAAHASRSRTAGRGIFVNRFGLKQALEHRRLEIHAAFRHGQLDGTGRWAWSVADEGLFPVLFSIQLRPNRVFKPFPRKRLPMKLSAQRQHRSRGSCLSAGFCALSPSLSKVLVGRKTFTAFAGRKTGTGALALAFWRRGSLALPFTRRRWRWTCAFPTAIQPLPRRTCHNLLAVRDRHERWRRRRRRRRGVNALRLASRRRILTHKIEGSRNAARVAGTAGTGLPLYRVPVAAEGAVLRGILGVGC
mmetsp:Transcript_20575/g.57170  ORF Transcript_20575/g.57170 Transcript_20575/m.57170 type:complete len:427 (+) Transcript_20575:613-1893(+)